MAGKIFSFGSTLGVAISILIVAQILNYMAMIAHAAQLLAKTTDVRTIQPPELPKTL